MKKLILKWVESWGYLVLTKTAKKGVFFDREGQKWKVFKSNR